MLLPEPASESYLTGLQTVVKFALASTWAMIFLASLRWPSRKIEKWLDEEYPDHTTTSDYGDYSVRGDLHAPLWVGCLWGFRFVILYAVASAFLSMVEVLNAIAESGYALSGDEVARLTVINSFAITALATVLAGVAFWWLIDWSMKETVEHINTPDRSTLGKPNETDRAVATDGGEDGGA